MDKLEQLERLINAVDNQLSVKDFEEAFSLVLQVLSEYKDGLDAHITERVNTSLSELSTSIQSLSKTSKQEHDTQVSSLKSEITALIKQVNKAVETAEAAAIDARSITPELVDYSKVQALVDETIEDLVEEERVEKLEGRVQDLEDDVEDVKEDIESLKKRQPNTIFVGGGGSSSSGGSGAVDSVNGETGVVVLTSDDISDTAQTNKWATAAEKTKLGYISVTQAVDLDAIESASHAAVTVSDSSEIDFTLTGQQISASLVAGSIDETKLDASVNASLDLADTAVQPAALSGYFNKSTDDTDDITEGATKKFNATHTGDVTGSTALTIDKTAITGKTAVTAVGTDYVLISDTSDSGNLKKALVSDLTGGGSVSWGSITGTLSSQTDLQTALDSKLDDSQATSFGLSLLDDANAAAARTTLGLGTAATSNTGDFAAASHTHTLTNVTDVTMSVANLNSLDDGVNSTLHFHDSDRSRANHTGTQTASTISDFNEAAQDAVGAMVDSSLTYVDATPTLQRAALTGAITASAGSNTTSLGSFTTAQLNTALSDNDIATGGGTATGSNSGDVTLAGTPNYITIAGQVITRALIDLTSHVTGKLPFANIADVATSTVMYRKTAGTGAMEAQTLATLKTDLGLTGTNSGDQTITLSGDVSGSGTGAITATIGANAVTNAKAAQMAANTLKGNNTGATANASDLTTTQVKTMLAIANTDVSGLGTMSTQNASSVSITGGTAVLNNAGLAIKDSDSTHNLTITTGSNLSANRNLTINTGDAARTITLSGDTTLSGTNTGDQTITLTSDVTGSGTGSFATTIASGVVSNSKLANVATATFKGRTTAGTGSPEDLTATQATALLDTFTSASKGLAPASGGGTSNFLRADGTWAAPATGGGNPGWDFVSYTTAAAATDITVSSLDLATDGCYKIILEMIESGTNQAATPFVRINGITTSTYNYMGSYNIFSGGAISTGLTSFGAAGTRAYLISTGNPHSWSSELVFNLLGVAGGTKRVVGRHSSTGTSNTNDEMQTSSGSFTETSQTNMTSITFGDLSTTKDWKVWVFKTATS